MKPTSESLYRVKPQKDRPGGKARRVWQGQAVDLYWKNSSPKPWANFVVFVKDRLAYKRSFYLAWNGERYAECEDLHRLIGLYPNDFTEIDGFLMDNESRFTRAPRAKKWKAGREDRDAD